MTPVGNRAISVVKRIPMRVKWFWWSLRNWMKGYKFGPVQRFRCCGHTTPYAHGRNCVASDDRKRALSEQKGHA